MESPFEVGLRLEEGYRFVAEFGEGIPPLVFDEQPPLGEGRGPNPARLLTAAVANCLAASALFCLRKARVEVSGMRVKARAQPGRDLRGRLRIDYIDVTLEPEVMPEDVPRIGRCLGLFEDFCIVTQSVRSGVRVDVSVKPVPATEAAAALHDARIRGAEENRP